MGKPKPLLQLGTRTFLDHMLANPFLSQDSIIPLVVLGNESETIRPHIPSRVHVVTNPKYRLGRTTSIQCGLRSFSEKIHGVLVWPVDCPLVPEYLLHQIAKTFEHEKMICIPSHQFKRGHPPLIGSFYFPEIMNLGENESLREIYSRHADAITHIPGETESILHNVNTPDDYQEIQTWYQQRV